MAFKKTAGRSNLVQPNGIPNFSGFKQAAASYAQIGELAYGIGLDDRKREFNQLIRQAEIDGKTAGVVYDEQGNLTPLTNFDYAKASETYSGADQDQILSVYRRAAVQTYVNASANDINDAATKALIENPSDPAAIRSSAQGYLQGLGDLDEDIFSAIAPKVDAAFITAENQALAQQRADSIDFAVDQGKKAFNQNSAELGVLYAKSAGTTNPAQATAVQDRIDEILAEQDDIINTLEANEVSPKDIDGIRDTQATVIASKVAQAGVERAYYSGGASEAYMMIKETVAEAELNPDVDSSTLRSVMSQSVQILSAIKAAETQQQKEVLSSIYGDLYRRVVVEKLDIVSEMANPESPIHSLEGTQQATLFQVGTASIQSMNQQQAKGYKFQYDNYFAVFENPTETTVDQAMEAMREIKLLHGMGLLGPTGDKLLLDASTKFSEALVAYQGDDIERKGSVISIRLNPNLSDFSKPPSFYRNEMYIGQLESENIIGKGGYWPDRDAFITDIGTYAGAYQKRLDLTRLAGLAESKAANSIMPTQQEINALAEVRGFNMNDISAGLLSEDEDVFMQNLNNVAGFAVQTRGLLHPAASFLLENASKNVGNADRSIRLMGQVVSAIREARGIDTEQAESIFFSNLNEETVAFLRISDRVGPELAVEAFRSDENRNRNATSLVANPKYSDMSEDEALEAFFMDSYNEALVGRKAFSIMQPYITDEDNQMLYQMAADAGVSNVEGMILSDPYVKQAMKSIFLGKVLGYKQYDPVKAMRDTLRDIGKRVGAQQNAYTGGLEFVTNPILPRAQATTGNAGATLGMNNINQDIKDIFSNSPGLIAPNILEQLMRVDEAPRVSDIGFPDKYMDTALHYVPNEVYGGTQTYKVILRTSYGQAIPLLDNYSFDFKRTEGYKSFLSAVETLKSDRLKNFWSAYGAMDQSLLQSGFDSLERNRSDRSFSSLLNIFNSTFRADIGDEALTKEEKDEFFYMIDRITSLGWR